MKSLIVYNPYSKKNKIYENTEYIKERLSCVYDTVDFFETSGVKSITKYLIQNSSHYDLVIASGGDGTVNEAVNGLVSASYKGKFAVIPSGTCNDFSHLLNYSKNIKKALDNILEGETVKLDICSLNDTYFTYASAIGKYTDVSYTAKRGIKRFLGRAAYFLAGLKEFTKYTRLDLSLEIDDKKISGTYYTLFALNTNKVAGFKIKREVPLKLDDGLIDIVLIEKNLKGISWPRLAYFFLFGARHHKKIKAYSAQRVKINSSVPLDVNSDGELALTKEDITINVLKQKLNIIVSKKIKDKYFTCLGDNNE